MTGAYVAISWAPGASSSADTRRLMALRPMLEAQGAWRLVHSRPSLWVFTPAARPAVVRRIEGTPGVVIGDLFATEDGAPFGETVALRTDGPWTPQAAFRRLTRVGWGRYVAVLPDPAGEAVDIFRDPLGGLDCLAWRSEGVTVAASELPEELLRVLGPPLAIDWGRVAALVADTVHIAGPSALQGLSAIFPGTHCRFAPGGESSQALWRPTDFARCGREGRDLDPAVLARTVDLCVGAWSARYRPILAELSGGLDSAVVAAALTAAPQAEVCAWLNYYAADPAADERESARAVADRLEVRLTEALKPDLAIDLARLAETADGPRPTLNGADPQYDADMARRCGELGAAAVTTGQGGDALFFQMPTALLAADRLNGLGAAGLGGSFVRDLAAGLQVSAWSVLRTALLGRAGLRNPTRRKPPPFVSAGTRRAARRGLHHPWLRGLAGTPPAKRLHIEALAYGLLFWGACRRGRGAALVHPLLSQPLVELCLMIPADRLAEGGRDRALARRAFEGRLPPAVLARRSKGDLTAYYGRALAEALETLRPFLIEGRLAAQGIVDPARLDSLLTIDGLMQDGRYADLMDLAAVEAWVRAWEARIARLASGADRSDRPGS